ncbi:macrophage migration inhibitory factor-like [Amphiura filiformis]|uniref:macrophage migration inhibitory factor-like n=1 Tax=Amphiura filiformis TaxID=82378 RepID=UPI003B21A455
MPTLQIFTNVPKASLPDGFVAKCSDIWMELIGKPKKFILVHVLPDQMMSFAGTQEPCAFVNCISIGKIGKEENKCYTEKITELLGSIGVAKDRMYVSFSDVARQDVGYDGTTFAFWSPSK